MGTLLLLSKFWTELWLSISEWGLLVFGLILSVGLVCEYRLEHNPPPGLKPPSKRRKRLKRIFEMLVIIGVAGEVFSDGGIFAFGSHLQTITEQETAAANVRAGNAEKDAGLANEHAANTELKVEELRKENAILTSDLDFVNSQLSPRVFKDWEPILNKYKFSKLGSGPSVLIIANGSQAVSDTWRNECDNLGRQIFGAVGSLGWNVTAKKISDPSVLRPVPGVTISFFFDSEISVSKKISGVCR